MPDIECPWTVCVHRKHGMCGSEVGIVLSSLQLADEDGSTAETLNCDNYTFSQDKWDANQQRQALVIQEMARNRQEFGFN